MIDIKTEKITPSTALKYLATSDNIRGLNEWRAREIAAQIEKGDWELNGESIKFDRSGKLVDGQHRLRGCVIANEPFSSVVVRGVPSAHNVDTGTKRMLYQVLAHEGMTYSTRMAPAINFIMGYKKNKGFARGGKETKPSVNDALRFFREHKELQEITNEITGVHNVFGRDSAHIALYYLFMEKTDRDTAARFYEPLISGVNLKATSPIYHLRERLIREHSTVHRGLDIQVYAGLVIKGWNLWRAGKKVSSLKYDYFKEGIPEIAG